MEDLIFFIFIVLFVLGPAIKKMFEGAQTQGKSSRQDVKEYLERMRTGQAGAGQARPQHPSEQRRQAPAAHPKQAHGGPSPSAQRQSYGDASRQRPQQLVNRLRGGPKQDEIVEIAEVVEIRPEETVEKPKPPQAPQKAKPRSGSRLHDFVMANPRYSDLQKAVILREVLNKPKIMERVRR